MDREQASTQIATFRIEQQNGQKHMLLGIREPTRILLADELRHATLSGNPVRAQSQQQAKKSPTSKKSNRRDSRKELKKKRR